MVLIAKKHENTSCGSVLTAGNDLSTLLDHCFLSPVHDVSPSIGQLCLTRSRATKIEESWGRSKRVTSALFGVRVIIL